jgi:hypothetical protein
LKIIVSFCLNPTSVNKERSQIASFGRQGNIFGLCWTQSNNFLFCTLPRDAAVV